MNNVCIGIIIVTYNRIQLLKECINDAISQEYGNVQIFVVNNASTDGTKEYLAEISKTNSNVYIQNMEKNLGGAGGFSRGMKFAYETSKCDYFLLIDDDAMLDKNYLQCIVNHMSENYLAYAGSVFVNGTVDISHRVRKNRGKVSASEYDGDTFVFDIATFCGLLVSRSIVKQIGFPREDFFIWNDDTEYCYRINQYSKILNVNGAVIDHKTKLVVRDKSVIRDTWKEYYGMRNIIAVYKQYSQYGDMFTKIAKCIGKAFQLWIMSCTQKEHKEDFLYNAKLRIDAVNDGLKGNFGINKRYAP